MGFANAMKDITENPATKRHVRETAVRKEIAEKDSAGVIEGIKEKLVKSKSAGKIVLQTGNASLANANATKDISEVTAKRKHAPQNAGLTVIAGKAIAFVIRDCPE